MNGARTNTLASLRGDIERLESPSEAHALNRVALGHAGADAMLRGGLAVGAVHEVFSEGRQSGAATGLVAGFAGRLSARRPLVWVRQDFCDIESGALSMRGLGELGLDPRSLVSVRAADVDTALRSAADALACEAVGAVVLEVWGEARQFDLVASRKLTLSAQASGVSCLVLRVAAEPQPSTAETRWIVQAARSGNGSWNGIVMSAFSANPRRILSLWLPRLPIDRIRRQLSRSTLSSEAAPADLNENARDAAGLLSPPLRGRGGEGGKPQ